ncbi:MAG TPA: hypothetical protein VFL78_10000 [Rhodanobacteraceae bacterium]|jgi:hypothetical protein|nr:hypothetical protein [Rhodanobacteraceae bacterium]
MEIDHTCANPSCNCRVENTGDFCSPNCREHADDKELTHCTCGHADCGTSTPETRGIPDQGS